ncbi:CLUMA_CG019957, isoform A [Clunio marinus]|uniref:CLUMA_CG019957, isoform A n=1 Tax=Clunio marinus TaxID=568069 RepID=A0A1J1J7T3_9DIPT|nr:CLUMA_CG019957, isoform A [Clunio marinus]
MTKPSVTRIKPRLMRSMRQHMPRILGQKGFGADIASTFAPMRLCECMLRPLRPVFLLLATE